MLTEDQIKFLKQICYYRWTEVNDMIDVIGNVDISNMKLTEIPVQFGKIKGSFRCSSNKLTTLKGAPSTIDGYFDCYSNLLTTLEGGPTKVGHSYLCGSNVLVNLLGAPETHNSAFICTSNKLTSLEGCPYLIKGYLDCHDNRNLHIMYSIGYVEGNVIYDEYNDLNNWIIKRAKYDIFVSYYDIAQWIKDNNRLEFLLGALQEIRQYFSPRILHLVDMGTYHNESKILDYKKFSSLC